MNELKLQRLLSRKSVSGEMDKFTFFNRIKSEHLFLSVSEAIEYLQATIHSNSFNPDSIGEVSSQSLFYTIQGINKWNLITNVIDEAICSIVFEIFQQRFRDENDNLEIIYFECCEFREELIKLIQDESKPEKELCFYKPLLTVFETICGMLSSNDLQNQEVYTKKLAKFYYQLMYTLYKFSGPYNDYNRKMENYYYDLISREIMV